MRIKSDRFYITFVFPGVKSVIEEVELFQINLKFGDKTQIEDYYGF